MAADRPDQPIIASAQPTATEVALLLQYRNRERLLDRRARERSITEAIRRAGAG